MAVQLIEYMGRASQGITQPYICRGDDDKVYFVKGDNAGRKSLMSEWICGHLARELGLPIPEFGALEIHSGLASALPDLNIGRVFGSQKQPVTEITIGDIVRVPEETQQIVLAFDWWIRNGDRNLSELGGNANLFIDQVDGGLVVIDHNQAFEADFSPQHFRDYHVFRSQIGTVFDDMVTRHDMEQRFQNALLKWPQILAELPEEWLYLDRELTDACALQPEAVHNILENYTNPDFWCLQ
ncbi:HipA family kinase [Microbulbifer sp. DLAB2-AF]|uniref:HipA family kinase n=1 Tax=Microbulbifer sp. DLAB2-AF TaxID=3243395 RepID=UPI004039A824